MSTHWAIRWFILSENGNCSINLNLKGLSELENSPVFLQNPSSDHRYNPYDLWVVGPNFPGYWCFGGATPGYCSCCSWSRGTGSTTISTSPWSSSSSLGSRHPTPIAHLPSCFGSSDWTHDQNRSQSPTLEVVHLIDSSCICRVRNVEHKSGNWLDWE